MNSTDQGFSIEGSITTALGVLLLFARPEQPGWRITLLVFAGLFLLNGVRKSQWAKRTNPIPSITGQSYADDDDTFWPKLRAYAFVILGVTVLGFVTWPPKPDTGLDNGVLFYSPDTSQIQFHTPKGILPNKSDVQPGAEAKGGNKPVELPLNGRDFKPPAIRPAPPTGVSATAQ
jgi:hypothetical protein